MSRREYALGFTLANPDLDTTIVGAKNPAHLRDNLAAAGEDRLPPDLLAEAKRRLTEAGSRPVPA